MSTTEGLHEFGFFITGHRAKLRLRFHFHVRKGSDFSEELIEKSWGKEYANESGSKFISRFDSFFIGFNSTIKLISFDESQVVTLNGEFVCGFRNGDCGTGSRSDNMVVCFFVRMELSCFFDEVFDSGLGSGSTSSELEARVCIQGSYMVQFSRKLHFLRNILPSKKWKSFKSRPRRSSRGEDAKRPRRRSRRTEKGEDQRCYPWTPEKETALCKGWVHTSKDSFVGNARKENGFWVEILKYMQETFSITKRQTYDMIVMLSIEFRLHFFIAGSSFNTRESGEGSINLNTTVGDEEDEVEEVRRPRPISRYQEKRKAKAGSTTGLANAFDLESLAKMMANKCVMANDSYNVQKSQEMSELLRIKNKELELKVAELKIRRMENRQRDEALYETTTDEDLKATLMQRLFG
ncbi:hypothetical protein Tco_0060641 [Tanacetum coccineum]